jgi:hypothetical protein
MSGGGGGISAEDRAYQRERDRIAQENFEKQQELAEQQFAYSQEQADLANQKEEDRTARISGATERVNRTFDNTVRQGLYDRIGDASFELNKQALDQTREDSANNLRFSLARAGLAGGSVDVDRNKEVVDRFNKGLLLSRNTATNAKNNAKSTDNQIRNSLLGAASSGNYDGSELVRGAGSALSAVESTPASVAPVFDQGDYFSDALAGIGSAAAGYFGGRTQGQSNQNNQRSNSNGAYFGSVS